MAAVFDFRQGDAPLLVSLPHAGSAIPSEELATMTPVAAASADTDWHVEKLYDFAAGMGASVLKANWSRYLIDLNRAPDGRPLYPGASNTELCPTSTFDEEPLYPQGAEPSHAEVSRRRRLYWEPYHACLTEELTRMVEHHGSVVLWEGHSIRSRLPRFFEGRLPDLNFGTADGNSASAGLLRHLVGEAEDVGGFTAVVDGRFKGGYITRTYGRPEKGIQAVQLELAQAAYMDEAPPFAYDPALAAPMKALLERLLDVALRWITRPTGN